jgi:NAD(P)-dependent dehydrogenase (short-subunit alcohol dehydrogenase family)
MTSAVPDRQPALSGKIALISGGAQGIGRAIAECFQREGARVLLLDCDCETGHNTAEELSVLCPERPVQAFCADLACPDDVHLAIEAIRVSQGRVDILVNNAGIELDRSFTDLTLADWDRIINVNLRGAFVLTKAALPLFPESGGAVVNISSIHATHAFANSLPYACTKAGLIAFTRNLALELAPRHIRVNAICPGYIDTRLWNEYLKLTPDPEAVSAQTTALHPLGRRGLPKDVAQAALFLASDNSSFVTGTNLVVDGGLTVRAHP